MLRFVFYLTHVGVAHDSCTPKMDLAASNFVPHLKPKTATEEPVESWHRQGLLKSFTFKGVPKRPLKLLPLKV